MKKIRFLKNKKGLAILDFIGQSIQTIVGILPKPLLFLLFLFILIGFSWFLSIVFNVFGVYCNTADVPVKLNTNIINNIQLIGDIPDEKLLGKEAISVEDEGLASISDQITECSTKSNRGFYITADNEQINFTTPTNFYDGAFCTDCQKVTLYEEATGRVGGIGKKWCVGEVARKESSDKSLLQKAFCGGIGCEPPINYYYDPETNIYVCDSEACEGITIGKMWDEKLKENGAEALYPTSTSRNPSADNLVGITCSSLRPRLAVYGVDVFDYRIWIFILILILLWWVLSRT